MHVWGCLHVETDLFNLFTSYEPHLFIVVLTLLRGCQQPVPPLASTDLFWCKKETCHHDTLPYSSTVFLGHLQSRVLSLKPAKLHNTFLGSSKVHNLVSQETWKVKQNFPAKPANYILSSEAAKLHNTFSENLQSYCVGFHLLVLPQQNPESWKRKFSRFFSPFLGGWVDSILVSHSGDCSDRVGRLVTEMWTEPVKRVFVCSCADLAAGRLSCICQHSQFYLHNTYHVAPASGASCHIIMALLTNKSRM